MHHVWPAARGMRTLYSLSSDRLWFALAVVTCLLLADALIERVASQVAPQFDNGLSL